MTIRRFYSFLIPAAFALLAGSQAMAAPTAEAAAAALPATVQAGPKGKTSEPLRHNVGQSVMGEGISMMAQAEAGYTIMNDPEKVDTTGVSITVQLITGEMAQMTAFPQGSVPTTATDSPNGCHDVVGPYGSGMVSEHWCDSAAHLAECNISSGTAYVSVSIGNGSRADARRIAESVHAAASAQGG